MSQFAETMAKERGMNAALHQIEALCRISPGSGEGKTRRFLMKRIEEAWKL